MQPYRLLAQTLSVWSPAAPLPKPPKTAPVRPHQGRSRCSLIQRPCLGANHRRTPLQPFCLAPAVWAVPAQAREAVCPRTPPVFVGVREPEVSQPLRRQSPPAPTSSSPLPWPRSTRCARSAPYGTGRLTAAAQGPRHKPRVCETASTIGHPGAHAPATSGNPSTSPAPGTEKGIYICSRKQRRPPLRVL